MPTRPARKSCPAVLRPAMVLGMLGLLGPCAFLLAESIPPSSLLPSSLMEFPFPAYDWRPAVLGPPTPSLDLIGDPLADYLIGHINPTDRAVCAPSHQPVLQFSADDSDCALDFGGIQEMKLAVAIQPKPWPKHARIVEHAINYQLADADEVTLAWTINGWNLPPASSRPPGTIEQNGMLYTPMTRRSDVFQIVLPLPRGTLVNYAFRITRTVRGEEVDVWDTNGPRWYVSVTGTGGFGSVMGNVNLARHGLGGLSNVPILSQEIRYQAPEAGEVFLVWGLNGWQVARGDLRPAGTVIRKRVMHSPMTNEDGMHSVRVHVPAGMTMQYGFLITRTREGAVTKIWDGADEYQMTVGKSTTVSVVSRVMPGAPSR